MGNVEDRIRKELVLNEEQLLENNVRSDPERVAELVEEGFLEFTEAGKQYAHKAGEPLKNVDGVLYIDSNSVRLIDLSETCKLLLYVAARVSKNVRMKSTCSSIWKKDSGGWKIAFHQRTLCTE